MNSRERCIKSILHEDVDRVPLILRIRPEPLKRLMKRLNVSDYDKLCNYLGVDVRSIGIPLKGGYSIKGAKCGEVGWIIEEGAGYQIEQSVFGYRVMFRKPFTHTYTYVYHPLKHMPLEQYSWPEIDESCISKLERVRNTYEDMCLYGGVTHMWEVAWMLTGFEQLMIMLFREPDKVEKILNKLHEIRVKQAKILCEIGVDVVVDGDDVGMQRSMMLSPDMWRKFLKPRYRELINVVHRDGAYFLFHSDGWIEPIIPDLIEIGVDILNPVQPECMDPAEVHRKYGDKLCFDGTISIQRTLPFGTIQDVISEVKQRIETIGYTGLILGPSHAIQPEVPIENIIALYDAAKRYGRNPAYYT